jgi:hypothetical protein
MVTIFRVAVCDRAVDALAAERRERCVKVE